MTKMDEVRSKLAAETDPGLLLAFCENVSDDEIRHVIRAYATEAEKYAANSWDAVHNAIEDLVDWIDTLYDIPGDSAAYMEHLRKIRAADNDAREVLDEALKAEEEYQRIYRVYLAEVGEKND